MGSAALSRRVEKVVGYPPLAEMGAANVESFTRSYWTPTTSRTYLVNDRRRS